MFSIITASCRHLLRISPSLKLPGNVEKQRNMRWKLFLRAALKSKVKRAEPCRLYRTCPAVNKSTAKRRLCCFPGSIKRGQMTFNIKIHKMGRWGKWELEDEGHTEKTESPPRRQALVFPDARWQWNHLTTAVPQKIWVRSPDGCRLIPHRLFRVSFLIYSSYQPHI